MFSSTVTGPTFKIQRSLNCDGKCLIYFVTCKQCYKQYMGETTDHLRNRSNNYKDNARKFDKKEFYMQEHLYKHFWSEGDKGFLKEVSVPFIDKSDGKNPKKGERYRTRTLKTILNLVCSRPILYYICFRTIFSVHYYFYSSLFLQLSRINIFAIF